MARNVSPEMLKFAEELARKRAAEKRTKVASPGFVDRMTSSAADPGAAQAEGDGKEDDGGDR